MSGLRGTHQILSFSSDQARKLLKYLEDSYRTAEDKNKQALVFVKRRFTAKVLYHLIRIYFHCLSKRDNEDELVEPIVKPDFIVGANAALEESIDAILVVREDRRVSVSDGLACCHGSNTLFRGRTGHRELPQAQDQRAVRNERAGGGHRSADVQHGHHV